jgi:hypothetical protein
MPDLFDDILDVAAPRRRWTDLHVERRSNARQSPNGEHGYQAQCFGCGATFTVKRRPVPGRHQWCDTCKASGEPAAQRARDYRERRSKIAQ